MKIEAGAKLVTIFVNSSDQWHGQPLYSAIVQLCLQQGIAGASVIRCVEGFGAGHQLHTTRLLALTENLPIRIEVVDVAERIEPLLKALEDMIAGGMVVISDVRMQRFLEDPKS